MNIKGFRKYSGYVMIALVVSCAVSLFYFVQYSSSASNIPVTLSKESFKIKSKKKQRKEDQENDTNVEEGDEE